MTDKSTEALARAANTLTLRLRAIPWWRVRDRWRLAKKIGMLNEAKRAIVRRKVDDLVEAATAPGVPPALSAAVLEFAATARGILGEANIRPTVMADPGRPSDESGPILADPNKRIAQPIPADTNRQFERRGLADSARSLKIG